MPAPPEAPEGVPTYDRFPDAPATLVKALHAMDTATERVHAGLRVFAVFRALQRRRVVDAVNNGGPADAMVVLLRTMTRDLVIGCTALFDDDERATHIPRIVETILRPEHRGAIEASHKRWPVAPDTGHLLEQLAKRNRRLKRPPVTPARARLLDMRHKIVAHADVFPVFTQGTAIYADIPRVLLRAAAAIQAAQLVTTGRYYSFTDIACRASREGQRLADALVAGIDPARP